MKGEDEEKNNIHSLLVSPSLNKRNFEHRERQREREKKKNRTMDEVEMTTSKTKTKKEKRGERKKKKQNRRACCLAPELIILRDPSWKHLDLEGGRGRTERRAHLSIFRPDWSEKCWGIVE